MTIARGTFWAGLFFVSAGDGARSRGHVAVEAGGGFQAPIGVGYCLGPLLGLLAQALTHR